MNRDFICGVCGLLIAVAYYAMASRIQVSMLADDVGPDGLPKAYAFILAGLSLLLMVRAGLRPAFGGLARSEAQSDLFALRRAAGMLLIGVAYVALVPWLGYPLCIAAVIAAAAAYQGGVISPSFAAIAIGGAIALWLVFVVVLNIAQPAGVWPDILESLRT